MSCRRCCELARAFILSRASAGLFYAIGRCKEPGVLRITMRGECCMFCVHGGGFLHISLHLSHPCTPCHVREGVSVPRLEPRKFISFSLLRGALSEIGQVSLAPAPLPSPTLSSLPAAFPPSVPLLQGTTTGRICSGGLLRLFGFLPSGSRLLHAAFFFVGKGNISLDGSGRQYFCVQHDGSFFFFLRDTNNQNKRLGRGGSGGGGERGGEKVGKKPPHAHRPQAVGGLLPISASSPRSAPPAPININISSSACPRGLAKTLTPTEALLLRRDGGVALTAPPGPGVGRRHGAAAAIATTGATSTDAVDEAGVGGCSGGCDDDNGGTGRDGEARFGASGCCASERKGVSGRCIVTSTPVAAATALAVVELAAPPRAPPLSPPPTVCSPSTVSSSVTSSSIHSSTHSLSSVAASGAAPASAAGAATGTSGEDNVPPASASARMEAPLAAPAPPPPLLMLLLPVPPPWRSVAATATSRTETAVVTPSGEVGVGDNGSERCGPLGDPVIDAVDWRCDAVREAAAPAGGEDGPRGNDGGDAGAGKVVVVA